MVERAVRARSVRWLTAFAVLTTGCSLLTDLGALTEGGGNGVTDGGGGVETSSTTDAQPTDGNPGTDSSTTTDSGNDAPQSETGTDAGCTTIPFTNGTTAVNDPVGDDIPWTTLTGAIGAGDGQQAVSATTAIDERSNRLLVRGFGFTVPAAATITDVSVEVTRSGANHEDERIELVNWNGSGLPSYGFNRSHEQPIPTVSAARTYSGTPAIWGMVLTPAIVDSSSFGFAFAGKFQGATGAGDVFLDGVRISITYCP